MDNVRKFCMVTTSQGLSIILDNTQEEVYSLIKQTMENKEEYTNSNDMSSQFTYEVSYTSTVSLHGYKESTTGLVKATMILRLNDTFVIEDFNGEENAQLTNQLSQEEN